MLLAAWGWVKMHWRWLLFPVGILLFLLGRLTRKSTPVVQVVSPALEGHDKVDQELQKKLDASLTQVDEQKQKQLLDIETEHAATIKTLTDDQKKQMADLRSDPDQLASFLKSVGDSARQP